MAGVQVVGLLFLFIFVFAVFMVARELMLWYWKVNRIVELLESIDAKLGASQVPAPTTEPPRREKRFSVE